jgi:hypothetical protein
MASEYETEYVRFASDDEENNLTAYMNEYLKRQLNNMKRVYGNDNEKIQELERTLFKLSILDIEPLS